MRIGLEVMGIHRQSRAGRVTTDLLDSGKRLVRTVTALRAGTRHLARTCAMQAIATRISSAMFRVSPVIE